MSIITSGLQEEVKETLRPPLGLHHFNFYTSDFEACRHFYEDIVGLPLIGFWIEPMPESFGNRAHVVGHAFFGAADGTMLAFIHYPDPDLQEKSVGTEQPGSVHIALAVDNEQYSGILKRANEGGYQVVDVDHGVGRSLYVRDPDGLLVEFNVPSPDAGPRDRGVNPHEALRSYLAGNRIPNTPQKHMH